MARAQAHDPGHGAGTSVALEEHDHLVVPGVREHVEQPTPRDDFAEGLSGDRRLDGIGGHYRVSGRFALIALGVNCLSRDALMPTATIDEIVRDKAAAREMVR